MTKKIDFITEHSFFEDEKPVPATSLIPQWYKKISPYINGANKPEMNFNSNTQEIDVNLSIKKCIPVLDSLASGYIIKTYCDIEIRRTGYESPYFAWPSTPGGIVPIQFHNFAQVNGYRDNKYLPEGHGIAKWTNIWSIRTPKNYSCLFLPPMHQNNIMTILPAIVDTDTYTLNINFPFVISDPNFEGIVPKGTPIAQVIPFKRDSWKSNYIIDKQEDLYRKFESMFFSVYKRFYWTKKKFD